MPTQKRNLTKRDKYNHNHKGISTIIGVRNDENGSNIIHERLNKPVWSIIGFPVLENQHYLEAKTHKPKPMLIDKKRIL